MKKVTEITDDNFLVVMDLDIQNERARQVLIRVKGLYC